MPTQSNPTAPLLTESEVGEIESDLAESSPSMTGVAGIFRQHCDALIRDWRALKTDLKYRCESLEELRGCRDRWLTMLNPTSPDETVDGAIRNLQQAYTAERDNAVELESQNAALREQLAGENQQRGLVIISALINFIDWLATQGVLVTNVPEPRASELRADLVSNSLPLTLKVRTTSCRPIRSRRYLALHFERNNHDQLNQ